MKTLPKVVLLAVLLTGCANHEGLIRELAKDPAAFCLSTTGTYGGGMIVPAPAVPIIGVRANLIVGRSNNPQVNVEVDGNGCKITGAAPVIKVAP